MTYIDYHYSDATPSCAHMYLMPVLTRLIDEERQRRNVNRIFDLGCGNGSVAATLSKQHYAVSGVDPSADGIAIANREYPHLDLHLGSAYDALEKRFGCWPVVISLEVIEHVYDPRHFARTIFNLLEDDGLAIISTPYHSYWKNVALSISGKMDDHFTALWDHGHIKFWSTRTLGLLLTEIGFGELRFIRCGRIPFLAKSMICMARKQANIGSERGIHLERANNSHHSDQE